MTPAKTFAPSVAGSLPRQLRPDEISFKTKQDGYVNIHIIVLLIAVLFCLAC